MKKVGFENVLMTDTDSCIFKYKTNDKKLGKEIILEDGGVIKLQSYLGGLTDEIDGAGMITQFVGLAPKMYSYEIMLSNQQYKKIPILRKNISVLKIQRKWKRWKNICDKKSLKKLCKTMELIQFM